MVLLLREARYQTATAGSDRDRFVETIRFLATRLEGRVSRRETWLLLEGFQRMAGEDGDGEIFLLIDAILRRHLVVHGANTFHRDREPTTNGFRLLYRDFVQPASLRPELAAAPGHFVGATIINETAQQRQQQPVATARMISLYPSLFVPSADPPVPSTTQTPDEDSSDDDDELPPLERVSAHTAFTEQPVPMEY